MTIAEPSVAPAAPYVSVSPAAQTAIALVGAVRRFPGGRGVGPVDLDVRAGETFALMGANGAGKTTLLRILATLGRLDSGTVRWWDEASPALARRSIGFSPDVPVEEETLSPRQTTFFWCRQWIRDGRTARHHTDAVLDQFGLGAVADEPISACSFGMRRRLSLAQALVHNPQLAFLDEPTAGLDPDGVRVLADELARRAAMPATTVVASNDPAFVQTVATRVALLDSGEVLRLATPAQLLAEAGTARLATLTIRGATSIDALARIRGVVDVAMDGDQLRVRFRGDDVLPRLVAAADAPGGQLCGLTVRDPDLRDCLTTLVCATRQDAR